MNELRVDIVGNNRGFKQAIEESVGISQNGATRIAENDKRASMQATDSYVGFWTSAIEKREAAEKAASERDIAQFKANLEAKWALQKEMADIAKGSGGYGSMPGAVTEGKSGRRGSGAAGMVAGQVAMDAASGGGMKEISKDAAFLAGGVGIQHFVTKLLEGKLEGLRRLPREIAHVVEGFARWGMWIAKGGGIIATIVGVEEILRASLGAGRAASQSNSSTANLRSQDASLASKLGLGADATHEQIVKRQKELLAAQDASAEKDAQAAAHKQTLLTLSKFQREEAEATVNAQTKLAMLLGDELDLQAEIAAANKSHDEETFLEKSKELLKVQREIASTTKTIRDEYNAPHKSVEPHRSSNSVHIDSLAALGGIGSFAAITQNPMLDTAKQQLTELRGLRTDIKSVPNIFSP